MAEIHKAPDHIDHVEESAYAAKAVPDVVKVEGGVLLDAGTKNEYHLKVAKDGHTVLLPQPSDNPEDPLLWSVFNKHALLFTLAYGAFTADAISGECTALIVAQGTDWGMNPNTVNHANTLNILLLGISALFFVPLSTWWGRAPTLFWSAFIALFLNLGVALSTDWDTYYVLRVLSGLFSNAPPSIAIGCLRDIFFFHERARKIGFWTCLFIASPYMGPLFANFMLAGLGEWRPVLWLGLAMHALYVCTLVVFLDETWYNRDPAHSDQPPRGSAFLDRMLRVTGFWQIRHHKYFMTLRHSLTRFFQALLKPVLLIVYFNYFIAFAWAVGINVTTAILFATPVEFGGYGYNYRQLGFLYFTPVVGILLGEAFGHFANDFLAKIYVRRHKGVFEPEVRLFMAYIAAFLMILGLVLLGQGLYHKLNVGVIIIGWGAQVCGLVILSVTTFAYAVDSYPTASAETAGWVSFIRVAGGFSVGYYQQPWGEAVGYNNSFGTQAALVGLGMLLIIVAHKFGHRLRVKSGDIN
ncbi:hypothetical protein A1O1_01424 [Capronia coronata CBS 617.96]|uniref:Major facilitator superfamily (MFS) profile domain-containing protein n=1 Tax=Capronia coronata CBS 617.96 TaxID=1182541 RepID=W9YUV8_9EURO|nr:uncharacterized protein A1O1_01424 [Capronia coronata CBS 617.96]EXJ96298.1 hypothetical protein A1O1_01424 [Capronia coronata CBS 617.96]